MKKAFLAAVITGVCLISFNNRALASGGDVKISYNTGSTKTFDCGDFYEYNGKYYITKETSAALDVNGQKIGISEKDLSSNPKTKLEQLNKSTYAYYVHLSDQHNDCVAQSAAQQVRMRTRLRILDYQKKHGKKPSRPEVAKMLEEENAWADNKYGNNREYNDDCTVTQALEECGLN